MYGLIFFAPTEKSVSALQARQEIWQALLRNQIFLSKHGHISFTESNDMIYLEFTKVVKLLSDHLKESGPDLSDL